MHFYFQHQFIPKIQKHIYFLAYTYKIQKHLSHIIFTLLYCYLFYCISYLFTYIHTLCLTATHGVKDIRQGNYFVGCLTKIEESFLNCSLIVPYKLRVSSWRKFTLATTLCTWSPHELAPCLVSSVTLNLVEIPFLN
jgi:hypothetical protein